MSTYNDEKYIKCAIDSILGQTFEDFEFIIINDGSIDQTQRILESYTDPRMKVIRQEKSGLPKSLNTAIKLSVGEYIARMDADDISLPERFHYQVELLDSNPTIGIVGTQCLHITEDGESFREYNVPTEDDEIKKLLPHSNPFVHGAVIFRRECVERAGLYNENFFNSQDYELWLRMGKYFKMKNSEKVLFIKRIFSGSYNKNKIQTILRRVAQEMHRENINFEQAAQKILRSEELKILNGKKTSKYQRRKGKGIYHFTVGSALYNNGMIENARSHFICSIRQFPLSPKPWIYFCLTYFKKDTTEKIIKFGRQIVRY